MARYKFDVPKGDMSKADKEALAKKIGTEAKAKAEVPVADQLGEHEYYGADVLGTKETNYEAKGKELADKAKEKAASTFGGFFNSLRENATKLANKVARAMNIGLGATASAAGTTADVAKGVGKEFVGYGQGLKAFATEGVPDLYAGAKEVVGANIDLASMAGGAMKDAVLEAGVATVAGGLEGAMAAEQAYKQGKEYASQKAAEAAEAAVRAKDATVRGAKTAAKGAAIAGAVGVGGVAVGTAAAGAAALGAAALGAAAAGGAALGAGYLMGEGMERGARFAANKAEQGRDALNRFGDTGAKAIDSTVATGKMKLEDAIKFATGARDAFEQSVVGLAGAAQSEVSKARGRVEKLGNELASGLEKGLSEVSKDVESGLKSGEKFVNETAKALESSVTGLVESAQAGVEKTKADLQKAVTEGISGTVGELAQVEAGVTSMIAEASETTKNDLKRIESDIQRGAERMNDLYNEGTKVYGEFNGRVTKARSAWDDFMNAGRAAMDAFKTIFGGKGKNKKLAQDVVKAMDAQKQLDALKESGS